MQSLKCMWAWCPPRTIGLDVRRLEVGGKIKFRGMDTAEPASLPEINYGCGATHNSDAKEFNTVSKATKERNKNDKRNDNDSMKVSGLRTMAQGLL